MVYIQELLKLQSPEDIIIDNNIALFLIQINQSNSHMLGCLQSE